MIRHTSNELQWGMKCYKLVIPHWQFGEVSPLTDVWTLIPFDITKIGLDRNFDFDYKWKVGKAILEDFKGYGGLTFKSSEFVDLGECRFEMSLDNGKYSLFNVLGSYVTFCADRMLFIDAGIDLEN